MCPSGAIVPWRVALPVRLDQLPLTFAPALPLIVPSNALVVVTVVVVVVVAVTSTIAIVVAVAVVVAAATYNFHIFTHRIPEGRVPLLLKDFEKIRYMCVNTAGERFPVDASRRVALCLGLFFGREALMQPATINLVLDVAVEAGRVRVGRQKGIGEALAADAANVWVFTRGGEIGRVKVI